MIRWVLLLTLALLSTGCASRRVGVYTDDPPRRLVTDGVVIDELKFDKTPLVEALALISGKTGITIELDAPSVEAAGIEMIAPVTLHLRRVPLDEALEAVGRSAAGGVTELGFEVRHSLIRFSTAEAIAPSSPGYVYDMTDLISAGMRANWVPGRAATQPSAVSLDRPAYLEELIWELFGDYMNLGCFGPSATVRVIGETVYVQHGDRRTQKELRGRIDAAAKQLGVDVRETAVLSETARE